MDIEPLSTTKSDGPHPRARRLIEVLYTENPYLDFPINDFAGDSQGWGSNHPVFYALIELLRPRRIVEVGSWKGGSAITMGRACSALGLDAEIICVDTWLGSIEHLIGSEGSTPVSTLSRRHGYPQLYFTFLRNVIDAKLQSSITPLPMDSQNAALVLGRLDVHADLIYIDAGHDFESASRDINAYWHLLAPDGVMFGHDYSPRWPGVIAAVDEFCESAGRAPIIWDTHWILARSPETDLSPIQAAIDYRNESRAAYRAALAAMTPAQRRWHNRQARESRRKETAQSATFDQ